MTETKTFKHPRIVYTWINDEIVGWGIHQFPAESFSSDEWDMEVTFTKKVKAVEEGTWCIDECGYQVYVQAVRGDWAWVTGYPNDLDTQDLLPDRVVWVGSLS